MRFLRSIRAITAVFILCGMVSSAKSQPYPASPYLLLNQQNQWGQQQNFNGGATFNGAPYIAPSVLVTQRAPTPSDDTTKGYAVGNLWQYDGHVWEAVRVTAGIASWQDITPPSQASLLGMVGWVASSAVVTAGGSGYSGSNCTITLASNDIVNVTLTGGAVSAATINTAVEHPTAPSGAQAQASTTCAGTGATITLSGAGPLGVYGTVLLNPNYSGNAIAVQRAGDASATAIGFLGNGKLNEPALWALCGAQACRVVTFYDQSGAANNLTASYATAPTIATTNRTGNALSIVFDNNYNANSALEYFTIPSGAAGVTTIRSSSVMFTGRMRAGTLFEAITLYGSDFYTTYGPVNAGGISPTLSYFGTCSSTLPGLESAAAFGYVLSTSVYTMWNGDVSNQCSFSGGTQSPTAGYVGVAANGTSYSTGRWEFSTLVIYNRTLTAVEQTNYHAVMYATQNMFPQLRDTIAATGDSILDPPNETGAQSANNQDAMRQLETKLQKPARIYNFALFGAPLNGSRCLQSNYNGMAGAAYQPGATNVYIVQGSWNDPNMQNSPTSAGPITLLATQQACVAQARATGYQASIITDLLPNAGMSSQKAANWNAIAALDAANWQNFAQGYASVYNDPTLGQIGAVSTSYFQTDGIHLSAYAPYVGSAGGSSVLADILSAQVVNYLHYP